MSEKLQVTHSLFSDDALLNFVGHHYDIGRVTQCKLLTRGLNDTYRVDAEAGIFVFRIYRTPWRSQTDVHYELDILDYLSHNEVPVSVPVTNTHGRWINELDAPEGSRCAVLFTYARGTTPQLDEETSFMCGTTLARMHTLTDSFSSPHQRSPLDLSHLLDQPFQAIRPVMSQYSEHVPYIASWIQAIHKQVPVTAIDFGVCHGDFHDWNMHLDGTTLTVFDFDCCGPGFRTYDLAVFLWNLKTNYKGRVQENWTSFLKGYTETRPMSEIELDTIPWFVAVRRIWLAGIYLSNEDVWGGAMVNVSFFRSLVDQLREDEQELGASIPSIL